MKTDVSGGWLGRQNLLTLVTSVTWSCSAITSQVREGRTGPDRDDGTSGGCGNRSALEYERKRVDMEIERRWVRMGSKWFKMVRMVSDAAAAARRRRQGTKRQDVTKMRY